MGRIYDDELRSIRRKSKYVYNRSGITPFLDGGIKEDGEYLKSDLYGYQIFTLFGDIKVDDDGEEI